MKKSLLLIALGLLFSIASFALYPIYGPVGECVGSTVTLTDTTTGGVWTSSDIAIATIDPTTGDITGVAAGTVTITYTVGPAYVTSSFIVSDPPAAITGTTLVCIGGSSILSDATPGGLWSGSGIVYVNSYTGEVSGWYAGATTISYTVSGCSTTTTFTVDPFSAGHITGDSFVCAGSTITLTESITGGTWSSGDPSIATVSGAGIVTGVSTGHVYISYTATSSCGTVSAVDYINSNGSAYPGSISWSSGIPIGSSTTLTDWVPGGTWSSSNPSVATIDPATGLVTGISIGTTVISYGVTQCSTTTYATIGFNVYSVISGHVNFTGTPFYGSVKVWLITYNPSTFDLEAIDSTYGNIAGGTSAYYEFRGAPTDSFRIKATVDSPVVTGTGYIPTYHTSNFYWYDATVLYHNAGVNDTGQDINMATGIVTTGPGFIAGDVTTGANKGTAGGAPATGLHLCIVNSTTHAIVQQTHTDASGHYSFSNLPVGQTYYVFPDSLNYITTAYSGITLTPAAPSMTTAKFTMHTVSHTITPFATGISNITSQTPFVTAFPNPTTGKLNIQWNVNATEKSTVTIADITGRQIYTNTINMNQGTGTFQADLSALTNGLYMISVKSATINYNNKIQVQH